jgi:hypothetical protein
VDTKLSQQQEVQLAESPARPAMEWPWLGTQAQVRDRVFGCRAAEVSTYHIIRDSVVG